MKKGPLVWLFDIGDEILPSYMGVSKNRGTPKSSILIGVSIIFTIHFGVLYLYF